MKTGTKQIDAIILHKHLQVHYFSVKASIDRTKHNWKPASLFNSNFWSQLLGSWNNKDFKSSVFCFIYPQVRAFNEENNYIPIQDHKYFSTVFPSVESEIYIK